MLRTPLHLGITQLANPVNGSYLADAAAGSGSGTGGGGGITRQVRAGEVDYMTSAAWYLELPDDALFLGVALFDRFMATRPAGVPSGGEGLRLVTVTCLWIAAK